MNFNPINKEIVKKKKNHYFKRRGNQHFTINEMFRYKIWDEQTAFWLVTFILKNDYAD